MKLVSVALSIFVAMALGAANSCIAQESSCMPGMAMPGCPAPSAQQSPPQQAMGSMNMTPSNFIGAVIEHTTSGTSAEPYATTYLQKHEDSR